MTDEFNDDLLDETDEDTKLVRDLRAQLRSQRGKVTELKTENDTFKRDRHAKSVASILTDLGVDPEYAEWYSAEDSSKEAVTAWVASKAKLLGYEASSDEDKATEQAAGRVSQATANAPAHASGGTVQELQTRLLTATTAAEVETVLKQIEAVKVSR